MNHVRQTYVRKFKLHTRCREYPDYVMPTPDLFKYRSTGVLPDNLSIVMLSDAIRANNRKLARVRQRLDDNRRVLAIVIANATAITGENARA